MILNAYFLRVRNVGKKVRREGIKLRISRLQDVPNYPLEKLEDLADALLHFKEMTDLETWLADHL